MISIFSQIMPASGNFTLKVERNRGMGSLLSFTANTLE